MARIFVGTLFSGEGNFNACVGAIQSQAGVEIQHHVVFDLPEREAHNALWAAWRMNKDTCDAFVKVDADTVLAHTNVISEFWAMMHANPRITGIQAPLLDYFTDGYINGLNCFAPSVTFQDSENVLFCDRGVDVGHDIVVKADGVPNTLRPAGYHAYDATDLQAFHYGVHRALKGQTSVLQRVKKAWTRDRDRRRAWALVGADVAGTFAQGGFNYTDPRLREAFSALERRFDSLDIGAIDG